MSSKSSNGASKGHIVEPTPFEEACLDPTSSIKYAYDTENRLSYKFVAIVGDDEFAMDDEYSELIEKIFGNTENVLDDLTHDEETMARLRDTVTNKEVKVRSTIFKLIHAKFGKEFDNKREITIHWEW